MNDVRGPGWKDDDDLLEGRVRRGRILLAGAAGLALLVALPFAFGILSGDRPTPDDSEPTGPTSPFGVGPVGADLHGRLAYTTFETEGSLGQRLVVLDLVTGTAITGPLLPVSRRPASSGAAFDDQGTVFAAVPGAIVVATDAGVFPLALPPDAPSPAGPLVWLP